MMYILRRHRTGLLACIHAGYLDCINSSRPHSILLSRRGRAASTESFPRIAQISLWQSLVPKFLRQPKPAAPSIKSLRSKEWNPATFFVVMFLLIGSNAIQMIALKKDFANFNRRLDSKIALLKEVIERVQRGEKVDVEGILGSGDEEKEREWQAVVKNIEEEDQLWRAKREKRDKKLSSFGDPEKASIPNSNESESSPAGTKPTSKENGSHSSAMKQTGENGSLSAPQTFY